MNKILKLLFLALCLFVTTEAFAGKSYYAKVIAEGESGKGKVYVSGSTDTPSDDAYQETSERSDNIETSNGQGVLTFELFAKGESGYTLRYWQNEAGDSVSGSNPFQVQITSTSTDKNNPATERYKAVFEEGQGLTVTAEPMNFGSVEVSRTGINIGDVVTLTAVPAAEVFDPADYISSVGNLPNKFIRLKHWKDGNGNIVGTDPVYSYTITDLSKEAKYTAVFELECPISGNGYYRIWTGSDAMIKVGGGFKSTLSRNASVWGNVEAVCNPYGTEYTLGGKVGTDHSRNNIYDDPSGIVYLTGTPASAISDYSDHGEVMNNIVLSGQGISSENFFTGKVSVKWCKNPGYYLLCTSVYVLKQLYDGNVHDGPGGAIKASSDNNDIFSQFEFNRVSRETMDRERYWFGACPAQEMLFDGGYWSSMYTSFPYELVEEDGHEAYIVDGSRVDGGETVLSLRKIESGIVPANTAVLVKCRDYTDLTDYYAGRGLSPRNRFIPLEADDERIDATVAEGNLLKGVFQLKSVAPPAKYTEETYFNEGYTLYDDATMRVFGVNATGNVGFYRLDNSGTLTDNSGNTVTGAKLASNRAYLDMTMLPAASQGAPRFRIETGAGQSGIDDATIGGTDTDSPAEYYTLEGIRVAEPVEGRLYIERRGTTVRKIVF